MRLLVSSILIIMGYFIYRLTRKTDETLHQLDDYKEHLITILNSIGDAVIACDTEQRIIGMNPISEKLTGWKESEASGKQLIEVFNIINEYTHEKAENPVEKVLKEGKIVGLANHTALISKDGRILSIADAGSPIIDKEGAIKGVVLIFRDVTDERKAQRELEESELRFRSVISNIYEGIAVTDETGTIIEWNKRMEQIHGLKREEVIGKKQWELQDKLYLMVCNITKSSSMKSLKAAVHQSPAG
jgi:PAS domain S-box-containing protein